MEKWRIFIDYGTQDELSLTESVSFKTKAQANEWAKKNGYPLKCVVKNDVYDKLRTERGMTIVNFKK